MNAHRMQAVAAIPGSTAARQVDVPLPGPPQAGEVLCRTLQLGICGTDREILQSAEPSPPPNEPFLVLGHECLGRIEAMGAGVEGWAVGDLVVPVVRRAVTKLERRVDLLPWGEFTERGIYLQHGFCLPWWTDRPEYLFRIQPAMHDVAILTEPLAVAQKGVHEALAIQQGRLGESTWTDPPPRVLVTGLGPIAFAAVLSAADRGWPVTVLGRDEPQSPRVQLAAELGAQYIATTGSSWPVSDVERDGFDLVLECTGSDDLMLNAATALRSCGVMVWLGSTRSAVLPSGDTAKLMRDGLVRNHVYVGSVNAAPRDFSAALACLANWQAKAETSLRKVITARITPADATASFNHRDRQSIKTVVMYDD